MALILTDEKMDKKTSLLCPAENSVDITVQ